MGVMAMLRQPAWETYKLRGDLKEKNQMDRVSFTVWLWLE